MDFELFRERYLPLLKEHSIPIILGVLGISLVGYGLMQSVGVQRDSREITFESGQSQVKSVTKTPQKQVVIDVEGAVLKPGIYKLPNDSRVQDALLVAGGISEKADSAKIAKGMNLAAKVIDGGKIYIPFIGETGVPVGQGSGSSSGFGETIGVININTASETELDTLSGVGPTTANKIINARPFATIEELVSKKTVGKSVFEKIKDKVVVN